jgi:RNA polymerase sigma-70 factor (ECF subfamily)
VDDFEAHRAYLRAVAYRMLGSRAEAEDAVQEAWLRVARADADRIRDTRAWLTTVVARICLDLLRSRSARGEVALDAPPPAEGPDPEQEAVLADSVGLALLVVLDTLAPAERLAFVLHDLFAVPFAEIAPIVGRSTDATKMLASRARRRVRAAEVPDTDPARQREVVEAFLAASRAGDFAALLEVLDPDVTVRAGAVEVRGARAVAGQALVFARRAEDARVVCVDGAPAIDAGTILRFTFRAGKIATIEVVNRG